MLRKSSSPEEDELHIEVQDVEFRLRATKGKYDSLMELEDGMYEYHIYPKELKLMIHEPDMVKCLLMHLGILSEMILSICG